MLCCQKRLFEKVEKSNTNDTEIDHHSEELSPLMKRGQREIWHLDFVLPIRKSIRKMVAEFSLMEMPKAKQYHTYHDRLGDGNVMLNELSIDNQRN